MIALALACLAVIGYKLSARRHATDDALLLRSSCDPSLQRCSVALPRGGQLQLSITPRPIRALQKLAVDVTITGTSAEKVEIDFDGVDMGMGLNRPVLNRNGQSYSGQAILPVCVTGTMTWRATVLATTQEGRIAAPFDFVVSGR